MISGRKKQSVGGIFHRDRQTSGYSVTPPRRPQGLSTDSGPVSLPDPRIKARRECGRLSLRRENALFRVWQ